jgi:MoxR-like ATPase
LPAKLLQVGSPAQPLFGKANVKEVQIDKSDWQTIQSLAMPAEYFYGPLNTPVESLESGAAGTGISRSHRAAKKTAPAEDAAAKPDDIAADEVHSLSGEIERSLLHAAKAQIQREPAEVPGLDEALQELGIYVGSAVLRHAAEQARIAAGSHLSVLLLGETETGKERFAHLIHRMSPRGSRDLVALNCAAIPESIAEDYLFGHMKGAFSGANADKKGMFESADQSTLFLDEIAELTLEVQAKLLRVIQDGVVQRLGSTAPRKVDVRIIAASNRDLRNEVSAGRFREDLYFRLEVVQIKLPALRERRSEIPELALALLRQINQRRHKPRQLSSAALMRLERYDWPGNVRQLSNVLERSVLYSRTDAIDGDGLLITDDQPRLTSRQLALSFCPATNLLTACICTSAVWSPACLFSGWMTYPGETNGMWTLQEEFSCIEIGRSSQFRNLTLFPLVRRSVPLQELDYLLLEDGIAQGKVRVTELNASGSVPELRLENTADLPVLLKT